MTSMMTRTISNNQGTVTVSSRAGRLLFALLLSPGASVGALSMLAGVPRKFLPACVTELTLALEQEQSPDPNAVGAKEFPSLDEIITHNDTNVSSTNAEPPTMDPEDVVLAACKAADLAANPKAQALAVVDAWRLFFPKLAYAEEVARKQDLSPKKAREWIDIVKPAFPGSESTTVFGWLGEVDEAKLLSMQFPLAWVNSRVVNKTKEEQERQQKQDGMAGWRQYAQKIIDQGGNNHHGTQDSGGSLLRIARRVQASSEEPS